MKFTYSMPSNVRLVFGQQALAKVTQPHVVIKKWAEELIKPETLARTKRTCFMIRVT
jgi:hypothetical protein